MNDYSLPELDYRRYLRPVSQRQDASVVLGGESYLDFSSNDYLSLSSNTELRDAWLTRCATLPMGSGGSRLLGGDHDLFHEFESELAAWFNKEAALLFSSGFLCNSTVIRHIAQAGDVIFWDRLCHASIVDGVMQSKAKSFRFRHNDCAHLAALLHQHRAGFKRAFIVTEGIFSMDGDAADLPALLRLKHAFDAQLYVDEAHSVGLYGPEGQGVAAEFGVMDDVDIVVATFGKAFASSGAVIACSQNMKDYLINVGRGFIFSTSLPIPIVVWNQLVLRSLPVLSSRKRPVLLGQRFSKLLSENGFETRSDSHIVPFLTGSNSAALDWQQRFEDRGFLAKAIRPPTVPAGEARLRFSFQFAHTDDDLMGLAEVLLSGR